MINKVVVIDNGTGNFPSRLFHNVDSREELNRVLDVYMKLHLINLQEFKGITNLKVKEDRDYPVFEDGELITGAYELEICIGEENDKDYCSIAFLLGLATFGENRK